MDPSYFKYLNSMGADPSHYIEMQANYLRMLANYYNTQEKPAKVEGRVEDKQKRQEVEEQTVERFPRSEPKVEKYLKEVKETEFFQAENPVVKKPAYDHDEVPIRSLAVPFEKLLEDEIQKSSNPENTLSNQSSKHSFLKRKSQITPVKKSLESQKSPIKPEIEDRQSDTERIIEEKISFDEIPIRTFVNEDYPHKENSNRPRKVKKPRMSKAAESSNNISDSPKPKQVFLKRGEGKLCIRSRSTTSLPIETKVYPRLKHTDSLLLENSNEYLSDSEPKPEINKKKLSIKLADKYEQLIKELEEKKLKLEADALDFYKMRDSEVKSLELWKREERQRIEEERSRLVKISEMPAGDPFETEKLKREVANLKLTIKRNEEKSNNAISGLQEIIESLSLRNKQLEKTIMDISIKLMPESSEPENKPKENQIEIKPKENHKENKPKENHLESKPKEIHIENKPKENLMENKPKENHLESKPGVIIKSNQTPLYKEDPQISQKDSPVQPRKKPSDSSQKSRIPAPTEIKIEEPKSQPISDPENKTQKLFDDGKREILFSNGVKKEIFPDGYTIVHFNNKDTKEIFPDGKIVYHFFENKTVQTTFADGLQLFQFVNGQTEKHFSDGTKEIKFPDGTIKCIFHDGEEESMFPDGTVQKIDRAGVKYVEYVNGLKDIINPDGSKIRKFPDGKIKKTPANL